MFYQFVFCIILCVTSACGATATRNETDTTPSSNHTIPHETATVNSTDNIHRLSNKTIPQSYILKISPDFVNSTFNGSVDITLQTLAPTNTIELHSRGLNISQCKVTNRQQTSVTQFHLDPENDLLIIELPTEVKAKRTLNVLLDFHGILAEEGNGFIKNSYKVNNTEKLLAFTRFEPTHARSAFPCFDEPQYKTTFKIYIQRDLHLNALSNMPLKQTFNSLTDNRVWDEFETSPPMPTYLVSFVISEFSNHSAHNKSLAVWTRENMKHNHNYIVRQGVRSLEQIEKLVGIPYMLPKLDLVSIHKSFNVDAIENWGLITLSEGLLNDQDKNGASSKRLLTEIQCHEISHQWFGDLVTPAWWDYLWLKEAFATYYQFTAEKELEPSFRGEEWFTVESIAFALWKDNRVDRALTTKVEKTPQLGFIYDTITHDKGAAVIRMLEHILSPKGFQRFVNNFLTTGRDELNGVVTQDDFFDVLEEEVITNKVPLPANTTISQIMKTWTENTGYPLITVTRDFLSQTATFTQTTYKTPRAQQPQPNQQWIVPLTYTTGSRANFSNFTPTLWSFAKKPVQIQISSLQWILCNLQRSGYYRVNYDIYNWELLIGQLLINHVKIPPASRAQLLDDAFAMAYDDIISYMIPVQMTLYLPQEQDAIPWYAVSSHLERLGEKFSQTPTTNVLFKKYVQFIIKNQYERIGFKPKSGDDESTLQIRPKILQLACAAELPACVRSALGEYENHKSDISKIHPDLKQTVFRTALRHARNLQTVQNDLLSLYEKSDDKADKEAILTAVVYDGAGQFLKKILSQTTEKQIIERTTRRNNFDDLASSKISLAYLHHMNDEINGASNLKENQVSFVERILSKIDTGAQADVLLNLLQNFKNKLSKYQHKYDSVIDHVDRLYAYSGKISQEIQNKADKLKNILASIMTTLPDQLSFKLKETLKLINY